MPKRSNNRLSKRREVEAVEAQEKASGGATKKAAEKATAKKATAKKRPARRTKAATLERKRLVWGIFSGSLREEARFPYDQRAEADAKLEQLRSKSKRLYFLQPIKEVIGDESKPVSFQAAPEEDDEATEFEIAGDADRSEEEVDEVEEVAEAEDLDAAFEADDE